MHIPMGGSLLSTDTLDNSWLKREGRCEKRDSMESDGRDSRMNEGGERERKTRNDRWGRQ